MVLNPLFVMAKVKVSCSGEPAPLHERGQAAERLVPLVDPGWAIGFSGNPGLDPLLPVDAYEKCKFLGS